MRIVIVEGMDGTGKSTFVKGVENHYISKGLKTQSLSFPRTYPTELDRRFKGRLNFYLEDFRQGLSSVEKDTQVLVLDRFIYSTAIYQGLFDDKVKVGAGDILRKGEKILSSSFPQQTSLETVFVTCNVGIANRRIMIRNSKEKDDLEKMNFKERFGLLLDLKDAYEYLKHMTTFELRKKEGAFYDCHVIEIDSSKRNPEEMVEEYVRRSFEPEYFGL